MLVITGGGLLSLCKWLHSRLAGGTASARRSKQRDRSETGIGNWNNGRKAKYIPHAIRGRRYLEMRWAGA
jgi:hypothetical protein